MKCSYKFSKGPEEFLQQTQVCLNPSSKSLFLVSLLFVLFSIFDLDMIVNDT